MSEAPTIERGKCMFDERKYYTDYFDMFQFELENSTQCAVYDQTPCSDQKKINIVVRPSYTVDKVISDISTQYGYSIFDLVLQPANKGELVYLNDSSYKLIYDVPGFQPQIKNTLILLPRGQWNGNVNQHFDLSMPPQQQLQQHQHQQQQPQSLVHALGPRPAPAHASSHPHAHLQSQHMQHETPSTSSSTMHAMACRDNGADLTIYQNNVHNSDNHHNHQQHHNNNMMSMIDSESLNLSPMSDPEPLSDDDLALGASASPTESDPMNGSGGRDGGSGSNDGCDSAGGSGHSGDGDGGGISGDSVGVGDGGVNDAYGMAMLYACNNLHAKYGQEVIFQQGVKVPVLRNYDELLDEKCTVETALLPASTTSAAATAAAAASIGSIVSVNGYVGLVNQAMTCYLNSLLQALYMTPEFRNALYRWEFDNDNEAKSIPYQLQKLFLNLQTSKKPAVETTDLTRSFGWDSTEAWQQHDIQELCRVMFDALEHKFKNTQQQSLISSLYEGKMIDYVKCLECNTEKTRADTFLDIPLSVRPFGSTVAYGSIEEALRAFVQPETLDGNNQYFCEKCNKKCDAHKGLKFKTFPYVLTLHLKRFDFDYQTMHRMKLNDKVTFPQTLNLNLFIDAADAEIPSNGGVASVTVDGTDLNNAAVAANGYVLNGTSTTTTTTTNIDDCSTTDSGSAMEEDNCSSGVATTANSSQHENDINDDDEGIDMSTSTSASASGDHRSGHHQHNHHNLNHHSHPAMAAALAAEQRPVPEAHGPYVYELFAIMIHSGSASGGHYYVFIKEFENNEWFRFNDTNVAPITLDDIQKSFGGSANKAYYSSVYSSSTNAYMLMYRQVDAKRNEHAMTVAEFPSHIQTLLPKLAVAAASAETRHHSMRSNRNAAVADLALPELVKPRIYFYNPQLKKIKVTRFYSRHFDVQSVLESAYQMHSVEQFAPIERCRIVSYDSANQEILQSFEMIADQTLAALLADNDGSIDFLLEYRAEGQEFETYLPGGATWYVHMVNLSTMEMDGPYLVYSGALEANDALRYSIAVRLHVSESEMLVATIVNTKKAFVAYDPHPTQEAQDNFQALVNAKFRDLTYFYVHVPNTDPNSLEIMGIPALELMAPAIEVSSDMVDAVLMVGSDTPNVAPMHNGSCLGAADYAHRRESPLPPNGSYESNSEDSSLSDGDRTLVESLQNRGGGDSLISSNSHSPQLSSPEDESSHDSYNRIHAYFRGSGQPHGDQHSGSSQYFHAIRIDAVDTGSTTTTSTHQNQNAEAAEDSLRKPTHMYKILVDSMMRIGAFKRHIEALLRVPGDYFKIVRKHDPTEAINPSLSLVFLSEAETLIVELGRVLQPDEHKALVFFMRLEQLDNDTGKLSCACEWIYSAAMTVADAKRELIAKLHRIDAKYHTLTMNNCRLWLKGGRNPIKILGNDDPLGNEVRTAITTEYLIQECEEGVEPQPPEDSLTIFVRRWHPDKMKLDTFQELTLEKDQEIRSALAKITNIPDEHIAYTKISSSFPCTNISMLSINGSMSWFSIPATLDKYPLTTTFNGNVYFYKDVTRAPKVLSPEERRELNTKEKARLDRLGCISTSVYSPRRERALKIHLDSPQASTSSAASTTPVAAAIAKLSTSTQCVQAEPIAANVATADH